MSNFVLIAIIIIFAVFTYVGSRRGLVRTVFSLFSSIVVLLAGTVISPVISNHLRNNEKIFNAISERVEKSLENYQKSSEKDTTAVEGTKKKNKKDKGKVTEKTIETDIDGLSIPTDLIGGDKAVKELISDILKNDKVTKAKEDIQKEVNHRVAIYLTAIVINSGTFIMVYLFLSAGLFVLGRVLNVISRLPVLNELNRLGGGIAGFFKGLIIIWLIFAVMMVFIDKPVVQEGMRQIDDNVFLTLLYKYNIIARVIGLK